MKMLAERVEGHVSPGRTAPSRSSAPGQDGHEPDPLGPFEALARGIEVEQEGHEHE